MILSIKRYLSLFMKYLKFQWRMVLLLGMFLMINITLQLLNPKVLANFVDGALRGAASNSLLMLALLFVGIALVSQAVSVLVSYLGTNVAWTATNRLRRDLVAHCLALDLSYYKEHSAGEMIERIDGDTSTLANFFSKFAINLLSNIFLLLGALILFFTIQWFIGIIMLVFTIVTLTILMYLRHRAIPFWVQQRQMSATFFGFLGERLAGSEDIKANGASEYILRCFILLIRQWFPINRKAGMAEVTMGVITLFMFTSGILLILGIGAYLWRINVISVGTVYLLFAYAELLQQPIYQILTELQDLQQAEASIRRIEELMSIASQIQDGTGDHCAPSGALSVAFQDVTFSYDKNAPVIRDITFKVSSGMVLGLLGRTGSGKTTLVRLLFRLYDPQKGMICVGGVPIQKMKLPDLRRCIGMVTQDVQIFNASVRDNLTFFDSSIPDEEILKVIDEIGLSIWYRRLPNGLATQLGSDGKGLSAGEAQLLAFIRVFLANPGLVILDEASSRLDPATEQLVERAVTRLFMKRTAIVIAHRLATIQHVDDILIIDDGCIIEYGSRETLISDPTSRLSQLLRTNLKDFNT